MDARGEPITLDPELRRQTHTHIIGSSGTGKSKFLEWLIRQDLDAGHGLCVVDWHGTLYHDVLRYCAFQDLGVFGDPRRIILLNPSEPDHIVGFNPFASPSDPADVSTLVTRRINATIRPWGVTDTTETPTFARVCRVLYTFMVETGETLPNAAEMLFFQKKALRDYAASVVKDHYAASDWQELQNITRSTEWKDEVLSTKNRLVPFVASKSVRRFMGLHDGNLDLTAIMDRGDVLLVNLADSDFLDRDAARVFASLLLLQFFEIAMRRAAKAAVTRQDPNPFMLYLDEFQEYMTDDIAAMLDQVRKGGLHMVLAHQHLGHFVDNPRLKKSVFTNARIKAVFGGLDYEDAAEMAREMFLSDLNQRQIKKAYYHTIHLYREETRTVKGRSSGRSDTFQSGWGSGSSTGSGSATVVNPSLEGWFGDPAALSEISNVMNSQNSFSTESQGSTDIEASSETVVPVWVPIPTQELTTEAEWTREEKLDKVVETLKCQQQRHCFIKLDTLSTQPLCVPHVRDYGVYPETLLEYEHEVHRRQGALAPADVDRKLIESRRQFFENAGIKTAPGEFSEPPPIDFLERK